MTIFLGCGFAAKYREGGGNFSVPLQWMLGLRRLKLDAIWLELLPSTDNVLADQSNIRNFQRQLQAHGLAGRYCLLYQKPAAQGHDLDRINCLGISKRELRERLSGPNVLLNLAYSIHPPLLLKFERRVFCDLDPSEIFYWMTKMEIGQSYHHEFWTIGLNVHADDCRLPKKATVAASLSEARGATSLTRQSLASHREAATGENLASYTEAATGENLASHREAATGESLASHREAATGQNLASHREAATGESLASRREAATGESLASHREAATGQLRWKTFYPLVDTEFFRPQPRPRSPKFTTVGQWYWGGAVEVAGEFPDLSKKFAFEPYIDLPGRVPEARFELAMNIATDDPERERLRRLGWQIVDPHRVARTARGYRRYLASALAEFTAIKGVDVAWRTGWISDRAAAFLALGRPVITEDTGAHRYLPAENGFCFVRSGSEAEAGVREVLRDWSRLSKQAGQCAVEVFDAVKNLRRILDL
jgi:hypothetical protein